VGLLERRLPPRRLTLVDVRALADPTECVTEAAPEREGGR